MSIVDARCLWIVLGAAAAMLVACTAEGAAFESFTEPYRRIDVAAAETGVVELLAVREGETVKKGQTLAILDSKVLAVAQEIAAATAESAGKRKSAEAERDLRQTRLRRLQALRQQGHASQEELDRAQTELAVAEANLLSAREQHRLDELEQKKVEAMLQRRLVRSPIDGVVTQLHREEQEFVSNNAAAVATVAQLDPLRVVFTVPTTYALAIRAGQTVDLAFPENGARAQGKIELVSPVTEAQSGTVRVKVTVPNPQGQYRCGVRCTMTLEDGLVKENRTIQAGTPQVQ